MIKLIVYLVLTILISVTLAYVAIALFEVLGGVPTLIFLLALLALVPISRRMS